MGKALAAVVATAALAGIGGFAYAQVSQPVVHEAPMVVVPAAQVVPSPAASATAIPTTTAPAPVATTAAPVPVAPKVAAPAPVESAAPAPAPAPIVKRYAVSAQPAQQPAAEPAPRETGAVVTNNDGSTTIQMKPGQQPPIIPARPAPEPPAPSS